MKKVCYSYSMVNVVPITTSLIEPLKSKNIFCRDCMHNSNYYTLLQERGYWEYRYKKEKEETEKLRKEIEILKAKLKLREHQLFGKKSEKKNSRKNFSLDKKPKKKRGRGQQPGTKGHGRSSNDTLPAIEEDYDIPDEEKFCGECGLPYKLFPTTEDSEVIEIEVKAHKRIIKRKKYKRACSCDSQPCIITAPGPEKLIPRGRYGISFWVIALLDKFYWQCPTHRLLQELETYGLHVSQGTVTGGFKRISPLLEPIVQGIIDQNRLENHWHADETRWQVFVEIEGKNGHRWYLWLFQSAKTVVFRLEPSRGAKVAEEHFGSEATGIISADRYSAYKVLLKTKRFLIAFCWSHVRRDFINLACKWPELENWAMCWVEKIGELYFLNEERLQYNPDTKKFEAVDKKLRKAIDEMNENRDQQLEDTKTHFACQKVLKSLHEHWSGLILFVDYPWIPMDNNTGERTIRLPVMGRKNYYGSGSYWSAEFTAKMFTIIHTLKLWGINPRLWLTEYLTECAGNGGKIPNNPEHFLPWNMSEEKLIELGADIKKIPRAKPYVVMRN